MAKNKIDEDDALELLDELDREGGVNHPIEKEEVKKEPPQKVTSLGKSSAYHASEQQLSAAEESPWKILNMELLPSGGLFYPADSELLIRSAKTKEIRHWSTMDESDPLDVREKISFILKNCTKFKIKGQSIIFNFNDFCEVDRYHLLFRIYELTFPNQENKLMANIRCTDPKCGTANKIQVTSQNLFGFNIPEELIKWYSEEERCFVVPSPNLNETIRFYLPTVGMNDKFRMKKDQDLKNGTEIDDAFYSFGPYMLTDWKRVSQEDISRFKLESSNWGGTKFAIVHKFTEALKKASINRVSGVCEKCKKEVESSIFLRGSFTIKDIFIVSIGLDELIGA
jgi:hypothetical protein